MSVRLSKPWRPLAAAGSLPGQLGVYELGDAGGTVLYIGFAGGRSQFGLRSAVQEGSGTVPEASHFRVEVTTAYHTRYRELLMAHVADHGALPTANDPVPGLGKLTPA